MSHFQTIGEELQEDLRQAQLEAAEGDTATKTPKPELVYYGGHVGVVGAEHFDLSPAEAGWAD